MATIKPKMTVKMPKAPNPMKDLQKGLMKRTVTTGLKGFLNKSKIAF